MNVSQDYGDLDSPSRAEDGVPALETERVKLKRRIDELKAEILGAEKRHAASQEQERQAFADQLQARNDALAAFDRDAATLRSERDDLTSRCQMLEEKVQSVEHRLAERESMLAQRAEELHQVWAQLHDEQGRVRVLEAGAAHARERQALESDRLASSEAWVFKLAAERARLERSESAYRTNLERVRAELATEKVRAGRLEVALAKHGRNLRTVTADVSQMTTLLERREEELKESKKTVGDMTVELASISRILLDSEKMAENRTDEIVLLTGFLREAEGASKKNSARLEWLRSVYKAMSRGPWWWSFLPYNVRRAQELKRLKRRDLFDAGAYLERYPDVRQEGQDPLRHYILHGMFEGRESLR